MLKPANRILLYEEIIKQIIQTVKKEEWVQGEKIPGEIELAKIFQVSRNVIREALKSLELSGIVETKSGLGTYVSDCALINIRKMELLSLLRDDSSIEELMETRLIIESELVYRATERATADDIDKVKELIRKSKGAISNNSYSSEIGMEFHILIARIARNRIMEKFLNSITDQLIVQRRLLLLKHKDENELLREINEHEEILNYIQNRQPEAARNVMQKHLTKALNILKEQNGTKGSSLE